MAEIATAWVTLAVSADRMQRDINRAFKSVDADGAGRTAGRRFSDAGFGELAPRRADLRGAGVRCALLRAAGRDRAFASFASLRNEIAPAEVGVAAKHHVAAGRADGG